jgi:hypothetical protein
MQAGAERHDRRAESEARERASPRAATANGAAADGARPRPADGSPACDPPGSVEAGVLALLEQVRAEVDGVVRSLQRALAVEKKRGALLLADVGLGLVATACTFAFLVAGAVTAGVLIVRGTSSALTAWTGRAWVGELGGGCAFLALLALGCIGVRSALRRRAVKSVRRDLGLDGRATDRERAPRAREEAS